MQNKREEWNKQYDGLVQGKIERLKALSPDARAELRARFADLFKEVEAALGEDPASPHAQELAGRYVELQLCDSKRSEVCARSSGHRCRARDLSYWQAQTPTRRRVRRSVCRSADMRARPAFRF
jgi:hypothetical protein